MAGLTNGYIQQLMWNISPQPLKFKGTYPCDVFLASVKENKGNFQKGDCYIVNLSSSNHQGSHFVCLYLTSKNKVEYFDPMGLSMHIDSNISQAINISGLGTSELAKKIQDDASQFCGLFCVSYLLCQQVGMSVDDFGKLFVKENLIRNNRIVLEVVKIFIEENYS